MPDEALVLLSLVLGLALAAAALLTLRRSGTVAAATREVAASGAGLRAFGLTADEVLGAILDRIDGVRRRLVEPAALAEELHSTRIRVEELVEAARELRVVPAHRAAQTAVVDDMERAARALDMVEHGCGILGLARARGRELEAQTAIKRGYLNLLHAREALARHVAEGAPVGAGEGRPDAGRVSDRLAPRG